MELPYNITKGFVNKQNVRSFSNINIYKVLKSDDVFLLSVLKEDEVIGKITPKLKQNLLLLRENIKLHCKNDFREYFTFKNKEDKFLEPVEKVNILSGTIKALLQILPKGFYGNNHNLKIIRSFVKNVVYSMKGEYIALLRQFRKWDFAVEMWMELSGDVYKLIVMQKIFLWLLENVVSPIICLNFYVTTCKLSGDENRLFYFWNHEWQSFYDKQIHRFLEENIIQKKSEQYLKEKFNLEKVKPVMSNIPKLYLILKPNLECRPIIKLKYTKPNYLQRNMITERKNFLKALCGTKQEKIDIMHSKLYQKWKSLDKPKLYFVKADLSNAFGSIDREKLLKILCERYLANQKKVKDLKMKRKFAQLYGEFISELKTPFLIRAGSTVYEWKRGLVQGYKYSPALSELYYSYMDSKYFKDLLQDSSANIMFFTRVVDDYLFITDSEVDAKKFLEALSNYRNINESKTVTNFEHPMFKQCSKMNFLGYSYDTETFDVVRANTAFAGQMCFKIGFSSAVTNIYKFIESRIGQSGNQVNGLIFNFFTNSEEKIWCHVFTSLCFSANKFCTILAILVDSNEMKNYLSMYKQKVTVQLCNTIIGHLIRNKPLELLFMYCINHFRYLSWKALLLCSKNTPKCNGLVPFVNDELAKSNCLFGKWREHCSRVDNSGVCRKLAVREVCARPDLRVIMKCFDVLPHGFQCFKKRL